MPKARRGEHGPIIGGRIQLNRETHDIIRTYTRYKLAQARHAYKLAYESHARLNSQQSKGRLEYAQHVLSHWDGLYSQGQHSVHPLEWADAWRFTTTEERHKGVSSPETPTIPGME